MLSVLGHSDDQIRMGVSLMGWYFGVFIRAANPNAWGYYNTAFTGDNKNAGFFLLPVPQRIPKKKQAKKTNEYSSAPVATGANAGAGGMRVLPKVFAGFGKRRRNAGRFAPRFSPARRRMRGRFACWPPAVGRPGKNKIGVQQKSNSKAANLGDWTDGRKMRQAGMFFSGVRQVGRDASACWPPAGARGEKKRGGFLTHLDAAATYWRRRRAGRKTRPAGKFFRGFRNKRRNVERRAPPDSSRHRQRRAVRVQKRKRERRTQIRARPRIFSVAPPRENPNIMRVGGGCIFHLFGRRRRVKLRIVRIAGETIPPNFFQKIFCGNFARAFFSKCFGPASPPPCQTSPLSPLPNSGGEFAREFFARPQRRVPSAAASSARHIPARPGRRHAHGIALRPSPDIRRALPLSPAAWRRRGRADSDGRDATFPAGCALLRHQRCTCAGNAARGMRDRSPGRAAAAERVRRGAFAVRHWRREAEDNSSSAFPRRGAFAVRWRRR